MDGLTVNEIRFAIAGVLLGIALVYWVTTRLWKG